MIKNKVYITYMNDKVHIEEMTVEEYAKFKNYNENKDNIYDIKMIFD